MASTKTDLVSFKVEPGLAERIDRLPNKSEFIRNAILAALDNTCPLCQGTGVLSPEQREHWERFTAHHHVERCGECHAVYLSCEYGTEPLPRAGRKA
ncbi:MAG TPA: ribbon-helix-helix domain-containing protein [Rectinemataceae bacterium]|nr:ribbon-helix-helix domain-containing protein [Rectinemataceae bacterium]